VPLSDWALTILWHRLQLPLWVDLFTGPVDVFHSPDFVLPPVRRARTILTVHDLTFMRVPQSAFPTVRAYLNQVVPRSVRRADLVLADSQCAKNDLVELLGIPPEKIEVVYAGIEPRFHPFDDRSVLEPVRVRYCLPRRFILTVGTLEPRKNHVRLIEAFARLRREGLKLVIAGGKGWMYEEIFAKIEELDLRDEVIFPGFIADEDLPALYNLAELFAYPSLYEGFGIPPLEAMACGTPVVASNTSSLPEVVGQGGLLVSPTDVEALAEAMQRLLDDSALREQLVARGLVQARRFTWRAAAERLLEAYLT
jgi:glycosyltransferase involved in cell wall biosynthesis